MTKATRGPSASGEETRTRIITATQQTLKAEGIAGTSARAIARQGDFNQALIFYHFGSVADVVVAAVTEMSNRRLDRHRERLEGVSSIAELIETARALHADDVQHDAVTVLTQAFAGAAGDPDMGPRLYAALEPWHQMIAESIDRVVSEASLPGVGLIPHDQIAQAISALFLGIGLLDALDPAQANAGQLFDSLEALGNLLETLMAAGPLLELFIADS